MPFGCFYTGTVDGWNSACAQGQVTMTAQAWGNMVRAADPGYGGPRPRVQMWHGTADTTLNYNNLGEEIKQWTNVLGVSQTPSSTGTPQSGWTRTRYNDGSGVTQVEAWNATVSQSGSSVTAANVSYDGAIAPDGSVSFGFQGTWASNDTAPGSFSLNGVACG